MEDHKDLSLLLPEDETEEEVVEVLPKKVTTMCNDVDRLLQACVDLLEKYQEIRDKMKLETKPDEYPYSEMNALFGCIADFCEAVQDLHLFLKRIKSGELKPDDDFVITKLGTMTTKLQEASTGLLKYRENLKRKIKQLKLEDEFKKLFEKSKKGLTDRLVKVEKLVDDIIEDYKSLLLGNLKD